MNYLFYLNIFVRLVIFAKIVFDALLESFMQLP